MEYLPYLFTGALVGMLSGIFGIGGGLVIVPILTLMFTAMLIPADHIMHMALGTSLATIIVTSMSSAMAHHRHGNVNWQVVRHITPGIIIGALLGAGLAALMHADWLEWLFACFMFYVATQMLLQLSPHPGHKLPGRTGMFASGTAIGTLSSMLGIGGGTLSVPFLIHYNCQPHTAIGTSAGIGIFIAVAGTAGYATTGWFVPGLPDFSLGYVYLPAVAGITFASILTAPLGVRVAMALPTSTLNKLFALLLYGLGIKMLWGAL